MSYKTLATTLLCLAGFLISTISADARHRHHYRSYHHQAKHYRHIAMPAPAGASGCVHDNNGRTVCHGRQTASVEPRQVRRVAAYDVNGHSVAKKRYSQRRSGACDGIHRCRCGTTAADRHGLPWNYNGHNLKQAVAWTHAFPHTSFQVGTVGYVRRGGPTGHVFSVIGGSNCQAALVYDDAGTYMRNVCGATFMAVGGGVSYSAVTKHKRQRMARLR